MKGEVLCLKYSVSRGNRAHTVRPFVSGFSPLSHSNEQKVASAGVSGERWMPRCFSYHANSCCGCDDWKKMPPMPVTRFMQFPPTNGKYSDAVIRW